MYYITVIDSLLLLVAAAAVGHVELECKLQVRHLA